MASKETNLEVKKNKSWQLFDKIYKRYDLINDILSVGIITYWRRILVKVIPEKNNLKLLDCATGTGQVIFSVMKQHHNAVDQYVGIDLSKNMMTIAKEKKEKLLYKHKIDFNIADAQQIPFEDNSFDCITMAFGIRNVTDYKVCLKELYRVLKPGGKALIMEFSLPKNKVIKAIYLLYFRKVLPFVGGFLSGDLSAYRYLNTTVESFPYGSRFKDSMTQMGFKASYRPLTFGIATLYQGFKV